jgi:hypothetical protein
VTSADLHRRLTFQPRYVVMGWRLRSYTVGHAILFDRLGVDSILTGAEVALAAWICSQDADAAERRLAGKNARWWMRWIVWTRSAWMTERNEVQKAIEVFSSYLEEQTRVPVTVAKGQSSESGVPFCQRLRAVLLSRLNYSPDDVANTPYLRALWDYIAWAEMEGGLSVPADVDDETEQDMIRRGELFAERLAKGEIKLT